MAKNVLLLYYTQEEADTRMILHAKHASDCYRGIFIHISDTDVVVLAITF